MATIRSESEAQMYDISRPLLQWDDNPLLRDLAFNRHSLNDGEHVSPYDQGHIDIGLDRLTVRLVQGIDEESFKRTLSRAQQATIGIPPVGEPDTGDWEEMMKGGLQTALESQTIIFEVIGVARATTHQIVRSRRAAFHQQSMRASWFGAKPNTRMPESIWQKPRARDAYLQAVEMAHRAYMIACEEDVSYQDARYVLPIGTETYIMCEYPVREFLAVYAYRACSMFQWEISHAVREMGRLLVEAHPWMAPYVKISCQDGPCYECHGLGYYQTEWADTKDPALLARLIGEPEGGTALLRCEVCDGTKKSGSKCTFQGWEQVEDQCGFPWAKEELRTYKPQAHLIESIPRKKRDTKVETVVPEGWEPLSVREARRQGDMGAGTIVSGVEPDIDIDSGRAAKYAAPGFGPFDIARCPYCNGKIGTECTPESGCRGWVEVPNAGHRGYHALLSPEERAALDLPPLPLYDDDITPVPYDEAAIRSAAERHPSRWPVDPLAPVRVVPPTIEED